MFNFKEHDSGAVNRSPISLTLYGLTRESRSASDPVPFGSELSSSSKSFCHLIFLHARGLLVKFGQFREKLLATHLNARGIVPHELQMPF